MGELGEARVLHPSIGWLGFSVSWIVGEHFTSESEEPRFWIFPGITRQPGFPAGFFEKLFVRKTMFRGNLWQKESALRAIDDQKPVAPNLKGFRKNWFYRGEQGNLDAHLLELRLFHRGEASIFQGSAHRAADDSLAQRFVWLGNSNASLQASSNMKRDEDPAPLGENSATRYGIRKLTLKNSFADSLAG